MGKITNKRYNLISLGLLLITFIITVLWINNSILLTKWYFYIIWLISILVGVFEYWNSKKYEISKLIKTFLLVITIFLIFLFLGTVFIYFINLSMT